MPKKVKESERLEGLTRTVLFLFCQQVKASGILDTIKPDERKRQEVCPCLFFLWKVDFSIELLPYCRSTKLF